MRTEGKPDFRETVSTRIFPRATADTTLTQAGSAIPDTTKGYLSPTVDLISSMEEAIWKRSSITTSTLWGATGGHLTKTIGLLFLSWGHLYKNQSTLRSLFTTPELRPDLDFNKCKKGWVSGGILISSDGTEHLAKAMKYSSRNTKGRSVPMANNGS